MNQHPEVPVLLEAGHRIALARRVSDNEIVLNGLLVLQPGDELWIDGKKARVISCGSSSRAPTIEFEKNQTHILYQLTETPPDPAPALLTR